MQYDILTCISNLAATDEYFKSWANLPAVLMSLAKSNGDYCFHQKSDKKK